MSNQLKPIREALWDEWKRAKFYSGNGQMINRVCCVCEGSIAMYQLFYERDQILERRWAHAECVELDDCRNND